MKKLFISCYLLISFFSQAQTYTNYTLSNTSTQLPNNGINDITKDKDGSLWFATNDGVSCYNGVVWKNYLKKDGLINPNVNSVTIDSQGNKWFGTRGGVSRFDGVNWVSYTTADGLVDNDVRAIAVDVQGNKWIGTWHGVSKFDGINWTTYYPNGTSGSNSIYCIAIDKQGNKWFGTQDGAVKFDGVKWTTYHPTGLPGGDMVLSITIESQNVIWFGTAGGVSKFDGTNWITYTTSDGLAENWVTSFLIDNKGNKWFGTTGGNVSKFDGANWTNFRLNSNVEVTSIVVDTLGNKWCGTLGNGVAKFDDSNWTTIKATGITDDGLIQMAVDSSGDKWFVGFNYGVFKFDGTDWTNYSFKDNFGYINSAYTIAVDALNNKWVGTQNGLKKFDGKDWTTYNVDSGLVQNDIKCIAIDAEGNKWIGTSGGISKFDGTHWTTYNKDSGLIENNILFISIDAEDNKWFGTYSGVSKFDGYKWTTYNTSNGLGASTVTAVAEDLYGNMWIAWNGNEGAGISKFDGTNWISYPDLIGQFDNVNSISVDELGTIWLGTEHSGVYKYNGINWINFSAHGNESVYNENVTQVYIDVQGNKWFMTKYDGVSKFDDAGPGPLKFSKIQRGVVFHDANSNGKKDKGEPNLPEQIIKVDNHYISTQNKGIFCVSLRNGSHTFTYQSKHNWKVVGDSSITVNISDTQLSDTIYFAVAPLTQMHAMKTNLTGSATRIGFQSNYWLNYSNTGTFKEDGLVSMKLDSLCKVEQTFPPADSTDGNRLFWKFLDLLPNEQRQVRLVARMPSFEHFSDSLLNVSTISNPFIQQQDTLNQILTGSFDPNDKQVRQGIGTKGYVLHGQELVYTIRFQNTGTDTAFTVNIRDSLDKNLNIQSIQILASSHPVQLDARGQNEIAFQFDNILLPDSNIDQLGSNGYVKFSVLPKKNLGENTVVKNKASIYFDYNPAVITNETQNTFVSTLPKTVTGIQDTESLQNLMFFPNPAKNEVTIVYPYPVPFDVVITDLQNKTIKKWNEVQNQRATLSLDGLEPGMYIYTVQGKAHQKHIGKLLIER